MVMNTNPIHEALGEMLCIGITALVAYLKKRRDLRKLRKEGKLID